MKKKIRKFQGGGFSREQEEWLGGADRTDPYILARMRRAVPDKKPTSAEVGDDSPAGKSGYGEENELPDASATRVAKAPVKTTTTTTTTKTTPKPTAAPVRSQEETDRLAALEKKQALTPVRPEELLVGGGAGGAALKALQVAGKKLAGKIAGNRGLKEYTVPQLPAPTPKLSYDKAGALAKKRADRAEMRDKTMREENAARYGVTDTEAPGYEALRGSMMRKGGKVKTKTKVYKSGGSVKSSASKRADGCAIRGKTRA
jgi:hypothetical protein